MSTAEYPIQKDGRRSLVIMFREAERFLSNFYPCNVTLPAERLMIGDRSIELPEMECPSTEHAYMAWKTIDLDTRQKMLRMEAGDAKEFSHQEGFPKRPDFSDKGRISIMYSVNAQKFSDRHPVLLQQLLDTGEMTLIEGNTWDDTFFGVDLTLGYGYNFLGRIQMDIRQRRRAQAGGDTRPLIDYQLPVDLDLFI